MRYGIWERTGVSASWYSDLSNGLLDDGTPFPSIFLSEEAAQKHARVIGLRNYSVRTLNVRDYCDLHLEEGSSICRFCDCYKERSKYE